MRKVALVVGEAIVALEIRRVLESEGYMVTFITSTIEDLLDVSTGVDLVIVDLDFVPLEGVCGVEVPLIFLTSECESQVEKLEIPALQVPYRFLYKPFTRYDVLDRTTQIL